jgi:hypothetical protein
MTNYSEKLNWIWQSQPANLSVPDKLLRVDSLACMEILDNTQFNHSYSANWFFILMIHILDQYLKLGLVKYTDSLVRELTAHHAYRFQVNTLLNTDPVGIRQRLVYYTVLRTQLRALVGDNLHRSRPIAE